MSVLFLHYINCSLEEAECIVNTLNEAVALQTLKWVFNN